MADDIFEDPPLTIDRGATKTFRFLAADTNGPLPITGGKAWSTVRRRVEDANTLVRKHNAASGGADAQCLILDQTVLANKGKFEVYLDPPDTSNLTPGTYVCDAWVELATGQRYLVTRRHFVIYPTVTTNFSN